MKDLQLLQNFDVEKCCLGLMNPDQKIVFIPQMQHYPAYYQHIPQKQH